jgi:hypothetical protein
MMGVMDRLFRTAGGGALEAQPLMQLTVEELLPGTPASRNEKIPEQYVEAVRLDLEERISRLMAMREDHVAEITYRQARLAETEAAIKTLQAALGAMMVEPSDG